MTFKFEFSTPQNGKRCHCSLPCSMDELLFPSPSPPKSTIPPPRGFDEKSLDTFKLCKNRAGVLRKVFHNHLQYHFELDDFFPIAPQTMDSTHKSSLHRDETFVRDCYSSRQILCNSLLGKYKDFHKTIMILNPFHFVNFAGKFYLNVSQ